MTDDLEELIEALRQDEDFREAVRIMRVDFDDTFYADCVHSFVQEYLIRLQRLNPTLHKRLKPTIEMMEEARERGDLVSTNLVAAQPGVKNY